MTNHTLTMNLRTILLVAALVFGMGPGLRAQHPEPEQDEESGPSPAELARQIRRNMLKIEEDLSKAGTHDPGRGEQVRKDLEKLLDSMKQRQEQVIKDIDEIVKQIKVSGSGSGGQGQRDSNENQKQSRARDRNKPQQNQGKPRDPNGGKPKPEDGKPQGKKGGSQEDNSQQARDPGENLNGDPRDQGRAEKIAHINLNEIWGNLPPELRQKLIDRNFDDFTPEYKEQINEYFRRTSSPKKE